MIPAGREVIAIDELAAMHQVPASVFRRRAPRGNGHPDPLPVTTLRRAPNLWDRQQVEAYLARRRVPSVDALFEREHPDDLLDRVESAALFGVSADTFRWYARERPHLIPTPALVTGTFRWWRRRDLQTWSRPGRGVRSHSDTV